LGNTTKKIILIFNKSNKGEILEKYKLPGWLWLIFGLAISIFAQIVMSNQENPTAMQLFFYIGLVFIAIGVFKIIIKIMLKPKESKYEKKEALSEQNNKFKVILCPNCKAKNYNSFNYCRNCGTKLH